MLEIYNIGNDYGTGYWEKIDGELTGKVIKFRYSDIKVEAKIKEKERYGFLWLKKRDVEKTVWVDKNHIREIK